jgi:non-specific serine/threonine protein kinase/serine/threonine-protein kinase
MGTVWLARRSDGSYEGKVAIKLVRPGRDSKSVLPRFEAERQSLALMNHPNIARVLDAGTAPDGRPFFVMEYVEGRALTEYCDERRLTLSERLTLFGDVCAGVQHAHRNGIIHRDLKPSNILVTEEDGRPIPKIIDFGIAKAVGAARSGDLALVTRQGDWIGTPAYMSPEQWMTGGTIDTRTDVYALGVVLHELLVGVRPPSPLDAATAGPPASTPREPILTPPTARYATLGDERATIALHRRTDPSGLSRAVQRDLDWIVMKAIERDPDRRYETVAGLSQDIGRYLANLPVLAGPPSARYRAKKFIRRHRAAVGAAAVAIVALIFAAVVAVVGYSRAVVAERKASAINAFLEETFSSADPFGGSGRETTIVQALDAATKRLKTAFGDQPEIRAAVLQTIGDTYQQLGRVREAASLLQEAVAIRRKLGPSAERELAQSLTSMGDGFNALSEFDAGERALQEAIAIERRVSPGGSPELAQTLADLADSSAQAGDRAAASREYEEAVDLYRRMLGPDDRHTWITETRFAGFLRESADLDRAETILRDVVERQRKLDPEDPRRAEALMDLSGLLDEKSRLEEAERLAREALAIRRKALGAEHPETGESLDALAWIVRKRGNLDEAEHLLREAIGNNRAGRGASFPLAGYLNDLASLLAERKDVAGAAATYEEALAIYRRDGGPEHPFAATTLLNIGILKASSKDLAASESVLRESLRIRVARFGAESRDAAEVDEALADTLAREARYADALEEARRAIAAYSATVGPENESTLRCRSHRAVYLWRSGDAAGAERELREVHDRASALFGPSNEVTTGSAASLATLLRAKK